MIDINKKYRIRDGREAALVARKALEGKDD